MTRSGPATKDSIKKRRKNMRNFVYVVTDVDKKSPNASESLILSMLPLKADWAEEFPIGKCCRKDFEEILRRFSVAVFRTSKKKKTDSTLLWMLECWPLPPLKEWDPGTVLRPGSSSRRADVPWIKAYITSLCTSSSDIVRCFRLPGLLLRQS